VTLRRRDGRLTGLRVAVAGDGRALTGTDLGRVPAPDAARYLLALAARADGDLGDRAILAATLADSATVWPDLLRLARNRSVPAPTRRAAVFWVSQAAEAAATRGLDSLIAEDATDRDVREQAVFALSQRPREEGVPVLVRIAQSHRDPEIRKRAIFWLGQSEDPRALALFEQLLTRP
jgi:HEAT repeat protein